MPACGAGSLTNRLVTGRKAGPEHGPSRQVAGGAEYVHTRKGYRLSSRPCRHRNDLLCNPKVLPSGPETEIWTAIRGIPTVTRQIEYRFCFSDGHETGFLIELEEPLPLASESPAWTRLGFHRCGHCPLEEAATPHCPLAQALAGPVTRLSDVLSYDEVAVEVITPERRILSHTSAQTGISAMMGLLIATSGCPHMAFFQPMARFHLPFATEEETLYRAASMYLLGQYFRRQAGQPAELGFDGLLELYRNVEAVNRAMANRLRAASQQDGTVNALVLLDMYAKSLPFAVEDALQELKPLYSAYLAP